MCVHFHIRTVLELTKAYVRVAYFHPEQVRRHIASEITGPHMQLKRKANTHTANIFVLFYNICCLSEGILMQMKDTSMH